MLILRALAEGPKQQVELRQQTGLPAQTTLRAQLKRLEEIGAIEKQRRNRFPGVLEYELGSPGRDLLFVADTLDRWLARAPDGPLPLGGSPAKAAIKSLAESWSTAMLRALATGPLSLTELDRVIVSLSYPSLERRLAAMRLAGHVEACPSNGRGTPYALTDWTRQGIGPLAAAARWERRHMPEHTAPIGRVDVEAAFLLSVPLLSPENAVSGSCRMAAEIPAGKERRLAGVVVSVKRGEIESCTSRLQGSPDAWALGSVTAWLEAVIEADTDRIEPGGDTRLARVLLDSLHRELFGELSRSAA
ncbi:MAG TPA: winged helix-turn-helix transcriptional regulator [Solirubrobacterales bacterium]